MSLATDLGVTLATVLDTLASLGLAATTTVTPADGSAAYDVAAMDATDQGGGYAPTAATDAERADLSGTRRLRLLLAGATTAGAALPSGPAVGDRLTWDGAAVAVVGVTPIQPGVARLALFVDVER